MQENEFFLRNEIMIKIAEKSNSKFFSFKEIETNNDKFKAHIFKGWNKSLIIKLNLKANEFFDSHLVKENFPQIHNKEKLFILTSGKVKFSCKTKNINLKNFDALNIFSEDPNYRFEITEDCNLFIVSSERLNKKQFMSEYFNFKKDIKAIDIWGGQCISRPYSGVDLNIVLFDLKPGFKFNDKGHSNEQITWLIDGNMDFYCNEIKDKLTNSNGVDIGANHVHGGVSNGAIGFDAFFPKRNDEKYRQNVKTIKF